MIGVEPVIMDGVSLTMFYPAPCLGWGGCRTPISLQSLRGPKKIQQQQMSAIGIERVIWLMLVGKCRTLMLLTHRMYL